MLYDDDTPTDTLNQRMDRLALGIGKTMSDLPIYLQSQTGFRLDDIPTVDSTCQMLETIPKPLVVLFDSFSKQMTGNPNNTRNAIQAMSGLNRIRNLGATVICNVHSTTKRDLEQPDDDFSFLIQGNTQIVAQCDTLIGCWANKIKDETAFTVRAKPRRTYFKSEPFGIVVRDYTDGSVRVELSEDIPDIPSINALRMFPLFFNDGLRLTINDCWKRIGSDLSETDVREALHELEAKGCLARDSTGKQHRFMYYLDPLIMNDYSTLSSYQEYVIFFAEKGNLAIKP